MKIEIPETKIFTNITNVANSFGIDEEGSRVIIEHLSKTIYKDPIGSIIREYVSNAWDANIEAQCNEPVIVSLDEDISGKYFSVKDFGPGISEERVVNVFCKYGKSTKNTSNDQIGGYGIGAKSAFAYTNTFFINTIAEGKLYKYILYKTNEGPKMQSLSTEPTDDRSGTEIKIYLNQKNSNDRVNFKEKISEQLRYFDNVYFKDAYDSNDYKIIERKTFKYSSQSFISNKFSQLHIAIGKVYYPIDRNICSFMSDIKLPFALKFNVGDLAVTLSREDIQYDDPTIEKIKIKYQEFLEEINLIYASQKFEFDNLLEYCKEASENPIIKLNDFKFNVNNVPKFNKFNMTFTPLKNYKIDYANSGPFFQLTSKVGDSGLLNKLSKHDDNHLDIRKSDTSSYQFIYADVNDNKITNLYLKSLHNNVILFKTYKMPYKIYVSILKLSVNRSRCTILGQNPDFSNNISKIKNYRDVIKSEYLKIFKKYSDIVVPEEFIKQLDDKAKLQKIQRAKLREVKSTESLGTIKVGISSIPKGKRIFKKEDVLLQPINFTNTKNKLVNYNFYIEIERGTEIEDFIYFIKCVMVCNVYVIYTKKDIQLIKDLPNWIHVDNYKSVFKMSKEVKRTIIQSFITNKINVNKLESLKYIYPNKFKHISSVFGYNKTYYSRNHHVDSTFDKIHNDILSYFNINISNLISPEIKYELNLYTRLIKHCPFIIKMDIPDSTNSLLDIYNKKILRKFGIIPGNNSYDPINQWELELLKENKEKLTYLNSIKQ